MNICEASATGLLLLSLMVICDITLIMSVTRKNFRSGFLSLFERQNMKQ